MPRFLVVEGNTAAGRARHVAAGGTVASEGYAELLRDLLPGARVDCCYPADPVAELPDAGLDAYDGVAITGSALHVYDATPEVTRQIDFVRAVLARGIPAFGSCWGLQILTVAAGGSVRINPRGRELGIARDIRLTTTGRRHPMFAGKPERFDAVTIHLDEIASLAPGTTVLAGNAATTVQAAEIRHAAGIAWGVQYHPEYTLRELAAIVRRAGDRLIAEGSFADAGTLAAYAADMDALHRDASDAALADQYGINDAALDFDFRSREVSNWIVHQVLPARSARGRA